MEKETHFLVSTTRIYLILHKELFEYFINSKLPQLYTFTQVGNANAFTLSGSRADEQEHQLFPLLTSLLPSSCAV